MQHERIVRDGCNYFHFTWWIREFLVAWKTLLRDGHRSGSPSDGGAWNCRVWILFVFGFLHSLVYNSIFTNRNILLIIKRKLKTTASNVLVKSQFLTWIISLFSIRLFLHSHFQCIVFVRLLFRFSPSNYYVKSKCTFITICLHPNVAQVSPSL